MLGSAFITGLMMHGNFSPMEWTLTGTGFVYGFIIRGVLP
jgi:hypothetical protein